MPSPRSFTFDGLYLPEITRLNGILLKAERVQLAAVLPYVASITPDIDASGIINVGALTGNLAIAAPAVTAYDGQTVRFRLQQDATGGRTYTWNAIYAFGTDIPAANLPTTANAKFEVEFRYCTADTKWRCVGLVRGF